MEGSWGPLWFVTGTEVFVSSPIDFSSCWDRERFTSGRSQEKCIVMNIYKLSIMLPIHQESYFHCDHMYISQIENTLQSRIESYQESYPPPTSSSHGPGGALTTSVYPALHAVTVAVATPGIVSTVRQGYIPHHQLQFCTTTYSRLLTIPRPKNSVSRAQLPQSVYDVDVLVCCMKVQSCSNAGLWKA
jgi:hypothetical protein